MKTKLLIILLLFWICLSNNSNAQSKWTSAKIISEMNSGQDIIHPTYKHRSFVQINDSIYYWKWDTISSGWKIDSKQINLVYDANNNLISFKTQNWDNSTWMNYSQTNNTYDVNDNKTIELSQIWNDTISIWENSWKITYT